jgi:tetratricopeptide (TPR) repeat protein
MTLEDFYLQLLKPPSPWFVTAVTLGDELTGVQVHLGHRQEAPFECPQCQRPCAVCAQSEERSWRHLDSCGKPTTLHARLPRVACPDHGEQLVPAPWANLNSPFTLAFEQLLLQVLKGAGEVRSVARLGRVEAAQLRALLRPRPAPGVGGQATLPTTDSGTQHALENAPPRQISLFDKNDLTLVNQGIQALAGLQLPLAVELFQKHQRIYPKGYDVTPRLAAAEALLQGFQQAPAEPRQRVAHLCRFWNSFEERARSEKLLPDELAATIKLSYFGKLLQELEQLGLAGTGELIEGLPVGYIHLQVGQYDRAIQSLQASIAAAPQQAALYGTLGDAYWLRGNPGVARQCYQEALLIDAEAVDWGQLKDGELKALYGELLSEYGADAALTRAWLPSHARINGLFARRVLRLHDGLKEFVDETLAIQKALVREQSPLRQARLFFRALVLCENEESLRYVKKVDLIQLRRWMKQVSPALFSEFLEWVIECQQPA